MSFLFVKVVSRGKLRVSAADVLKISSMYGSRQYRKKSEVSVQRLNSTSVYGSQVVVISCLQN
jgi:hypothetical protein